MNAKKSWNWSLWIGFLCVLAGFLTYTFFAQFPTTRDFPWANLLLFAVGGILLVLGLFRAFGRPQIYRGKIFGLILAALGVSMFGLFSYIFFYELRQFRLRPERRELDKKLRSSRCRIKMGRTYLSVISSADRKRSH
jgi:hypothetical protein